MKRVLFVFVALLFFASCAGGDVGDGSSAEDAQHRGGFGGNHGGGNNPTSNPNTPQPTNPNTTPTPGPTAPQTIEVVNNCSYTVWVGALSGGGTINNPPAQTALNQGGQMDLSVSTGWSGRIWGRTGCSFNASGQGTCQTGDCGGQEACTTGGTPPATLAEFTLNGAGGQTFYDVSLVDGFNIPLQIQPGDPNGSCGSPSCAANINATCPQALQVLDSSNQVIACESACEALQTAQACCTGDFGTSQTCSPTSYAQAFKSQCPSAYSYAYDDQTSTFTCAQSSFVVTFCP